MLDFHLKQLRISDGSVIDPPVSGVTIFVGPNNVGKSQCLRDIYGIMTQPSGYITKVVADVEPVRTGTLEEFQSWAQENIPSFERNGVRFFYIHRGGEVPEGNLKEHWEQIGKTALGGTFTYHADGLSRLEAGNATPNIDLANEPALQPLQRAYVDPDFVKTLSDATHEAFGLRLIVDRYGGQRIHVRVGEGEPPVFEGDGGIPTKGYLNRLRELPTLEHQGDGVRSYVGLLLNVLGSPYKVILIDEPEAFLHPPQAQRLGQVLAERSKFQQVLMATHSSDILQGALKANTDVSVVRITREGAVNHAAVLEPAKVKELWNDPLLRYSNVFDGLFCDAVILCEGDADCRYYASVLDAVNDSSAHKPDQRPPQVLFTHCGGKSRMAMVIKALRAVSVPVICVPDFDVLRQKSDYASIIEALGGSVSDYERDLAPLRSALNDIKIPKQKEELRQEIEGKLEDLADEMLAADMAQLRKLLKIGSGWDRVKESGKSAVPAGGASQHCTDLLSNLKKLGMHIVPVGETEGFVREVGGHGPSWVARVQELRLHKDLSNHEAVTFVKGIQDAISV